MNYMTEIIAFNHLIELEQLSTGQIALWYALMYINNKCGWKEWFTVPNQKLVLLTGLSRQSIVKARAVLVKLGAISVKTNGMQATSYRLHSLQQTFQQSLQASLQDGLQEGLQGGLQGGLPLIKQNKIKQNKYHNNKKSQSYDVAELDLFWDTVPTLSTQNNKPTK